MDALITEETLRSLFGHYGTVVDVALKKSKFDPVRELLILLSLLFPNYSMVEFENSEWIWIHSLPFDQ